MTGILIVAPRREIRRNLFDGFALRHRSIVDHLSARTRVVLAVIDDDSPDDLDDDITRNETVRAPTIDVVHGRAARLGEAARVAFGRPERDDDEWARLVRDSRCDRALTIGPWVQSGYRPVWKSLPSVHLFEEELQRVAALAPQSPQARALRRLEWWLESRSDARPERVVAISETELPHARRRFSRSTEVCVPFGLDEATWPVQTTMSDGTDVLVVGNFAEARNAEGLAEVLAAVTAGDTGLTFRVVSGPGLHDVLSQYLDSDVLRVEAAGDDVAAAYGKAWASLVPARMVTGQKTTILQAWACGTPVVSTGEAAVTVSAPEALLVGDDAASLVGQLLRLRGSAELRARLAAAGREVALARHTATGQNDAIARLLDEA